MDNKHFERDPVGLTAGIKICNLRKVGSVEYICVYVCVCVCGGGGGGA